MSIGANVLGGYNMGDVADEARDAIGRIGLPAGYHTVFGGDVQNLRGDEGLRARGHPAGGDLHLPDPGVAVRVVPAAAGDHVVAAVVVPWRRARPVRD